MLEFIGCAAGAGAVLLVGALFIARFMRVGSTEMPPPPGPLRLVP